MSEHPLEAENRRLREALTEAEAVFSIVEPRSDKAEYLRVLGVVRTALAAEPASGEALQRLQELADERSLVQSIRLKGLAAEPGTSCGSKKVCHKDDPHCLWPSCQSIAPPPPPTQGEETARLIGALQFYADPEIYRAIGFFPDPPCGDFMEDFSEVHPNYGYNRPMPGKRAREAIAPTADKRSEVADYILKLEAEVAALRQRADEATRAEREACAQAAERQAQDFLSEEYAVGQPLSSFSERFACGQVAAAIRARITPEGEP